VKFNDMPSASSKYALHSSYTRAATDMKRQVSRDAQIIGMSQDKSQGSRADYDVSINDISASMKRNLGRMSTNYKNARPSSKSSKIKSLYEGAAKVMGHNLDVYASNA